MPTVLRIGKFRFYFFSNEREEPAHIHVKAAEDEAKFWLDPVCLADNDGFSAHELQKIFDLVKAHCDYLQRRYKEVHGLRTRHHRKKGER